ncbi:hypothetical protein AVEN_73365-1 [Araneus ventricosus]|uniref:MATH domain-containing protein n=1 Tax=Araneus ventricosus TaxID=182803 RepID=A0A4Y1ZWW5_ARAVE|nr:hypothetical protein AVEN_1891-1 [Araneus ventricosus]GBL71043.1 hypothetical protein AVEN_73365-1 [Araneus ventricosus]
MASNAKDFQIVFRDQKENPDGHEVNYSFTVQRSDGAEMRSFSLDFDTTCAAPSSWSFGFFYEKVPETGKISCSVTLSRKDSGENILDVFALVTFLDADGQVVRCSESICSGRMAGGDVKEGTINANDAADLINQRLAVQISINISNCHRSMIRVL